MDSMDTPENNLESLNRALEEQPHDPILHLQRGKEYHRAGRFDLAYNDFVAVLAADPDNAEAREYISLLKEIFAFHYVDLYNP